MIRGQTGKLEKTHIKIFGWFPNISPVLDKEQLKMECTLHGGSVAFQCKRGHNSLAGI